MCNHLYFTIALFHKRSLHCIAIWMFVLCNTESYFECFLDHTVSIIVNLLYLHFSFLSWIASVLRTLLYSFDKIITRIKWTAKSPIVTFKHRVFIKLKILEKSLDWCSIYFWYSNWCKPHTSVYLLHTGTIGELFTQYCVNFHKRAFCQLQGHQW